LQNTTNGNTEFDRLQSVIHRKYFESVRNESHQNAARYAVLYAQLGLDITEASRFLQGQTSIALQAQFEADCKLVQATINAKPDTIVSEQLSVVGGIARIFESVAKMMAAHAYADQAFTESCTLGLLRSVQDSVDRIGSQYIQMFINKWKLDILDQEITVSPTVG
jgi:hypothetical protein